MTYIVSSGALNSTHSLIGFQLEGTGCSFAILLVEQYVIMGVSNLRKRDSAEQLTSKLQKYVRYISHVRHSTYFGPNRLIALPLTVTHFRFILSQFRNTCHNVTLYSIYVWRVVWYYVISSSRCVDVPLVALSIHTNGCNI